MITVTVEQWRKFAPKCPPAYTSALFDNMALIEQAGLLENEHRWCHFAATVYHETGDFQEIRENLSYSSAKRLREVWPSRFGHKDDAALKPLLKAPKALAEAVYGGRMGNRPGTSDAYDTRGGGWFNTTGFGIVNEYCEKLDIPYTAGVLDDPVATLKFAVLEWTETGCNACADENDLTKVAKAINTGSANSNVKPVGMNDRQKAFARAWKIWGESGTADVPASQVSIKEIAAKVGAPVAAVATTASQVAPAVTGGATPAAPVAKAIPKPPTEWLDVAGTWKSFAASASEMLGWAVSSPKAVGIIAVTGAALWFGPKVAPGWFGRET